MKRGGKRASDDRPFVGLYESLWSVCERFSNGGGADNFGVQGQLLPLFSPPFCTLCALDKILLRGTC